MCSVKIVGLAKSSEFHRSKKVVEDLSQYIESEVSSLLETDWQLFQIEEFGSYQREREMACWIDGVLSTSSESLLSWVTDRFNYGEKVPLSQYETMAEDYYIRSLSLSKKKYVQWWLKQGTEEERILIELDFGLCPKTCDNFWQLSNGYRDLSYKNTTIHRVVPNGYIEGGFIGAANSSINGGFFQDENYAYKHDKPGVIGMSKAGRHKNGSVFYITLRPLPHLNGRSVAFGRVVEGFQVIQKIAAAEAQNQRPSEECKVVRCENYLSLVAPPVSGRPRSQKEQVQSKLEGADLDTLMQRRLAILKEIESTKEELEQQKKFRAVLSQVINERKT